MIEVQLQPYRAPFPIGMQCDRVGDSWKIHVHLPGLQCHECLLAGKYSADEIVEKACDVINQVYPTIYRRASPEARRALCLAIGGAFDQ